jgi:hypothetical protein
MGTTPDRRIALVHWDDDTPGKEWFVAYSDLERISKD